MWMVIHQRINTMDIIERRNPNICLSPNQCISCKSSDEDLNHLFIHCPKAQSLWNKLFLVTGLNLTISNAKDLCLSLCGIQGSNVKNIISFNATVATLWTIWTDRNNQIFMKKSLSFENLWENIDNLTSIWSSKNILLKNYSQATISLNIKLYKLL